MSILYLSDHSIYVYSKNFKEIHQFNQESTEADRVAYLHNEARKPIYCLLDSIHEEYRSVVLPHVFGKDKKNLIARKMRRLFENKSYTYAVTQGRETFGRRDDKMLFTALNNAEVLELWINTLKNNKILLAGIYSVPLLSENLLNYLPKTPYTLLVAPTPQISAHSPLGLRQSFFAHQKIQLSRLIPMDAQQASDYAKNLITQVIKMQDYLSNAQLLPQTHILSVIVLAEPQYLVELAQYLQLRKLPTLHIQIVDIQDFAYQLGIPSTVETVHLNTLLAYQLSRYSFKNHYAKPDETRHFFHSKLRRAMTIITVILPLIAIGFGGMIVYEAEQFRKNAQAIQEKFKDRQVVLEKRYGSLKNSETEIQYIKNVVDTGIYINQRHIAPRKILEKIGGILMAYPELKIETLTWSMANTAEGIFGTAQTQKTTKVEKPQMKRNFLGIKRKVVISQPIQKVTHFFEGLKLQGTVMLIGRDYIELLEKFEKLKAHLQKYDTYWEIKNVSVPSYASGDEFGHFEIEILIKHGKI